MSRSLHHIRERVCFGAMVQVRRREYHTCHPSRSACHRSVSTILLKRDFNTQTFCTDKSSTARGCSLILFTLIHVSAGMCVLVPGLLMCSGICSSTFVSPVTECRHEGDLFIELARAPGITACIRETPLRICSYASRIRSLPICSSECLFLLWTLPTWQQ